MNFLSSFVFSPLSVEIHFVKDGQQKLWEDWQARQFAKQLYGNPANHL